MLTEFLPSSLIVNFESIVLWELAQKANIHDMEVVTSSNLVSSTTFPS